jgi:hypothetical protein
MTGPADCAIDLLYRYADTPTRRLTDRGDVRPVTPCAAGRTRGRHAESAERRARQDFGSLPARSNPSSGVPPQRRPHRCRGRGPRELALWPTGLALLALWPTGPITCPRAGGQRGGSGCCGGASQIEGFPGAPTSQRSRRLRNPAPLSVRANTPRRQLTIEATYGLG